MKKTLGILAMAIFSLMLFQHCQKSDFMVVTGVVRDSLTNQPLEGVYILYNGGSAITGVDGTFTLNGLQPRKQYIAAHSFIKYNYKSKNVFITEGQVNKIDFQLAPIPQPEIITENVFDITENSAKVKGSLENKSNVYIYQHGHCWSSTIQDPTINNAENFTSLGSGSGNLNFTSTLNYLVAGKVYYVRAYANTSNGLIYGNVNVFSPSSNGILSGLLAYFPFNSFYSFGVGWNAGYFWPENGSGNYLYSYNWITQPVTSDRFGNPQKAFLSSSPTYSYTSSPDFSEFNDFSVSFWFKKTSWAGSQKPILNLGYPNFTNYIVINETSGPKKLNFEIKTSSGSVYSVIPNSEPSLNVWHHAVLVRKSNSLMLYINGILQNITACDYSPIVTRYSDWYNAGYFFVGCDLYFTKPWQFEYFNGSLDEIRIYNRALKDTEIRTLYND